MMPQVARTKVDIDKKLSLLGQLLTFIEQNICSIKLFQFSTNVLETVNTVTEKLEEAKNRLKILYLDVLNFLCQWQRKQQLARNGHPFNSEEINDIETGYKNLIENFKRYDQIIQKFEEISLDHGKINTMQKEMRGLFDKLLERALIVDEQPEPVVTTGKMMKPSIRLLAGDALLLPKESQISVTAVMVDEDEARGLLLDKNRQVNGTGKIENNEVVMKNHLNEGEKLFSVSFGRLQFTKSSNKIEAKKRKSSSSEEKGKKVMEEKYYLLFESTIKLKDGQTLKLRTLSLPVTVIVHTDQKITAMGAIMWDDEFAEGRTSYKPKPDISSFYVPDKVVWSRVAELLKIKFRHETGGGELKNEHLEFLRKKLFGPKDEDNSLTWHKFAKYNLPKLNFNFWEWFCCAMLEVKGSLNKYWKENYIFGFIKRTEAEIILKETKKPGTFLIRFLETGLSEISIAVLKDSERVKNIGPYTKDDFKNDKLAKKVLKEKKCKYLYPATKKSVFVKFYKCKEQESKPDYDPEPKPDYIIKAENDEMFGCDNPKNFEETLPSPGKRSKSDPTLSSNTKNGICRLCYEALKAVNALFIKPNSKTFQKGNGNDEEDSDEIQTVPNTPDNQSTPINDFYEDSDGSSKEITDSSNDSPENGFQTIPDSPNLSKNTSPYAAETTQPHEVTPNTELNPQNDDGQVQFPNNYPPNGRSESSSLNFQDYQTSAGPSYGNASIRQAAARPQACEATNNTQFNPQNNDGQVQFPNNYHLDVRSEPSSSNSQNYQTSAGPYDGNASVMANTIEIRNHQNEYNDVGTGSNTQLTNPSNDFSENVYDTLSRRLPGFSTLLPHTSSHEAEHPQPFKATHNRVFNQQSYDGRVQPPNNYHPKMRSKSSSRKFPNYQTRNRPSLGNASIIATNEISNGSHKNQWQLNYVPATSMISQNQNQTQGIKYPGIQGMDMGYMGMNTRN